jgi:hypothetical protein
VVDENDMALVTHLYRASIDGRRFMYEAILSEDGNYEVPDDFTSRTAEILQVYLKSLGIRMETIIDDTEYIGEPEFENTVVCYSLRNHTIFCTINEMYYLNKLGKVYKKYIRDNVNSIDDMDEMWEYIMNNISFNKDNLTDNIIKLFKDNLDAFGGK